MLALPFYKFSPGGNPTLLFVARLAPVQQEPVARQCLHPLHLDGEQVGFVDPEQPALRMAGGEFCLNATRCLGLLLALEKRLPMHAASPALEGQAVQQWSGPVRTSGMPDEVRLHVQRQGDTFNAAVELPISRACRCEVLDAGFTLVRLPGIVHLLVDARLHPFPADWKAESARLRARYNLMQEDAAGCVWWSPLSGTNSRYSATQRVLRSDPVVAVRHPHTVCYESACGSGALALALAQAQEHGQAEAVAAFCQDSAPSFSIVQPSGQPIVVDLHCSQGLATQPDPILQATVGGPVRLVAKGEAYFQSLAPSEQSGEL